MKESNKQFDFYVKEFKERIKIDSYPAIILIRDNWNDFGIYTLFDLNVQFSFDEVIEIGKIKILDPYSDFTDLPYKFNKINQNYCSLGQSLEYYEKIKKYFPNNFKDLLDALNDVATNRELGKYFEGFERFNRSLLRFTSAEKAYKEAELLLYENKRYINEELEFEYFVKLPGAKNSHRVNFDFKEIEELPYRVNVIIGKNGTGKTHYLGSMVNSISGIDNKNNFSPYNPLFNKVIAISYSLFDDFPKPPVTAAFNYKYIGLRRTNEEIISDEKLSEKLKNAFKEIIEKERIIDWYNIIRKIINIENFGIKDPFYIDEKWIDEMTYQKSKRLSSGQSIILFILTELIANIEEGSLILFDEPETHLHPSAIAQLMLSYYEILQTFKSFSIISTHSPIIIQDIPSRYITIFDREGNVPIISKLPIESFGENISILTSTVFQTVNVKELYKHYFEWMHNNFYSIEKINKIFNNRLSFNAQLYFSALENSDEQ